MSERLGTRSLGWRLRHIIAEHGSFPYSLQCGSGANSVQQPAVRTADDPAEPTKGQHAFHWQLLLRRDASKHTGVELEADEQDLRHNEARRLKGLRQHHEHDARPRQVQLPAHKENKTIQTINVLDHEDSFL